MTASSTLIHVKITANTKMSPDRSEAAPVLILQNKYTANIMVRLLLIP